MEIWIAFVLIYFAFLKEKEKKHTLGLFVYFLLKKFYFIYIFFGIYTNTNYNLKVISDFLI